MSDEVYVSEEYGKQLAKDCVHFLINECDYDEEDFYEGIDGFRYVNHNGEAKLGRRVASDTVKPGEVLAHKVSCRQYDSIPKSFVHGNWATLPDQMDLE